MMYVCLYPVEVGVGVGVKVTWADYDLQTTNRRCQEWTMEFVRGLVAKE